MEGEGKQEEVSWEKQEMMAGMNGEQTADAPNTNQPNRWRTGQL